MAGSILAACAPGQAAKTTATGGGKVKVERKRLEFRDDKGKLVVEESGKSLPEEFPKDMPIYKPSQVKSTVSSRGAEESTMTMVIFKTKAKVADVAAFYQSNLEAGGWAINNVVNAEQGATFAVSKANQAGSIAINEDNDRRATIISINVKPLDKFLSIRMPLTKRLLRRFAPRNDRIPLFICSEPLRKIRDDRIDLIGIVPRVLYPNKNSFIASIRHKIRICEITVHIINFPLPFIA